MKKYFYLGIFITYIAFNTPIYAQDFNLSITIKYPGATVANRQIIQALKKDVENFFNNTSFSGIKTKIEERIQANINLNIISFDNDKVFKAVAQIQTFRPVYNSSYKTTVLSFQDKNWNFVYYQGSPVVYSDNFNPDEITMLLAYYAYVMLGFDADTFSMHGGTSYYNRAQNILNQAQNTNKLGWHAAESRQNRYWLIENVLNPALNELRSFMYVYHRQALDNFIITPYRAREIILAYLPKVEKALENRPNSYYAELFFTSKAEELINIYQKADSNTKFKAVSFLKRMNPANASKYEQVIKGSRSDFNFH